MRAIQTTIYIALTIGSQARGKIEVCLIWVKSYHILCGTAYLTTSILDG